MELMSEQQVAKQYGFTVAWLRRARRERRGPRFVQIGRMIRYRLTDVTEFIESCVVSV